MSLKFEIIHGRDITDALLTKCSVLFSENYGIWSKSGNRICMSPSKMKSNLLCNNTCYVVMCTLEEKTLGHAFCCTVTEVCWITQLVVSSNHRHLGIGQQLISHALGSKWKVAGLVTSHPWAVRALEKATRLDCDPILIRKYASLFLALSKIPYLHTAKFVWNEKMCVVNTHFLVDHREIERALAKEIASGNWVLGNQLPEGHEFIAIVFAPIESHTVSNDTITTPLTDEELLALTARSQKEEKDDRRTNNNMFIN
jgi:GNAT superfamily N-acetyltransferase